MRSIFLIVLYICIKSNTIIHGANILGIFLSPFKSHIIIHEAIAQTLHEAGHNITILSTYPTTTTTINRLTQYQIIHIPMDKFDAKRMMKQPQTHIYKGFKIILNNLLEQMNGSLHQPLMERFLKTHHAGDFDLVLFGYFYNDFLLGIAEHFKCPIILSFMVQSTFTLDHIMGQPREMAYVPSIYSGLKQPLDFVGRLKNFYNYFMEEFILLPWIQKTMNYYYNENFPLSNYRPLNDVYKNITLIFLNHHFSQGPIRPNQPGFIEIGGIQISEDTQPLPNDLEYDLKLSRENMMANHEYKGIIYFSLGSMIDNENLDKDKSNIIVEVLAEMTDYQIIMKWNITQMPQTRSTNNIVYRTWLPQIDILADKRTQLFITHGGQGAVTEAQFFGIPMVGIPFFADQHTNMERVEKSGFGLQIDYATLTKESFKHAIEKVLHNPQYKENIRKFSALYRDRPLRPRQLVTYWVDYVLRYRGAKHIQSPAIHLNWWQLHSFDIFSFLIAIIIAIFAIIISIIKYICGCFFKYPQNDSFGKANKMPKKMKRLKPKTM